MLFRSIGSAGSGKTAVTLARLREAEGRVLYVTLSAYLAQSARALHAAHSFENQKQEVEFLSYRDLLETLRVPPGREVTLPTSCRHSRMYWVSATGGTRWPVPPPGLTGCPVVEACR